MASKCYLLMTPITLLLLIPIVGAIAVYGYATINKGREERPPSPKRDGGGIRHAVVQSPAIAVARRTQACPPPPGPRPRDSVSDPAATTAALLFLPPALSLVHPALYLPASIPVLLTPARNSARLPTWLFFDEKMCYSGDILCTAWKLKHQQQKKRDHEQAY
jgi:hypothetical protein